LSVPHLEHALGHAFTRPEFLRQALTHRSHSSPHNERLEFLGDSLLNCVVTTLLYQRFPDMREGDLSRLRASLVCQETLAEIASGIGLGEALLLGEGELKSGGFRRPSILADGLEAVLGAIYLDAGFEAVHTSIRRLFMVRIDAITSHSAGKDAKTELQEWLQARKLALPRYTLLRTQGEAHAQEFSVSCAIASMNLLVEGNGTSRRAAEQQAARAMLDRLATK